MLKVYAIIYSKNTISIPLSLGVEVEDRDNTNTNETYYEPIEASFSNKVKKKNQQITQHFLCNISMMYLLLLLYLRYIVSALLIVSVQISGATYTLSIFLPGKGLIKVNLRSHKVINKLND